jgi:hypothetical protein
MPHRRQAAAEVDEAEPLRLARSHADFLRECKARYSAIPKPKTETALRPWERLLIGDGQLWNGRRAVGGRRKWGKYA